MRTGDPQVKKAALLTEGVGVVDPGSAGAEQGDRRGHSCLQAEAWTPHSHPGPARLRPSLQQKPSLGRLGAEDAGLSLRAAVPRTPAGATGVPSISREQGDGGVTPSILPCARSGGSASSVPLSPQPLLLGQPPPGTVRCEETCPALGTARQTF